MIAQGLAVMDIDGYHDDEWCWPKVRMRLKADGRASEFRVGVWLRPEDEAPPMGCFTFSSSSFRTAARFVNFGEPVEISFPLRIAEGEEFTVEVECDHLVADKGEDKRELSFKMLSLVLL